MLKLFLKTVQLWHIVNLPQKLKSVFFAKKKIIFNIKHKFSWIYLFIAISDELTLIAIIYPLLDYSTAADTTSFCDNCDCCSWTSHE